MNTRIYTDTKGHERAVLMARDALTLEGEATGGPFAVIVFEREEIIDETRPSREYVQPVLFTGDDADEINAAITDFMGPDGDGDITTEAWLETCRGVERSDLEFDVH